jgi:drug/metabolite transporter (DMT)-like permease
MKPAHTAIATALLAAVLFGLSTPLAKALLAHASPWMLAALFYLGSGVGLWVTRSVRGAPPVRLARADWRWLVGAIVAGGIAGPLLLMNGLAGMSASGASLLLNAEAVFTALLAWFVFRENVDARVALGMLAIVAGAVVLAWPANADPTVLNAYPEVSNAYPEVSGAYSALLVLGACFCWGLDNNLTRKVALNDAAWIAMMKGLAAGSTNLLIALSLGAAWPGWTTALGAACIGFLGYGASLALFVVALRHLGSARTGAYFSIAPFFGAAAGIVFLAEPLSIPLLLSGALMAVGLFLHLTERHEHVHSHRALDHTHEHQHGLGDPHHEHTHDPAVAPGTRHTHQHHHSPLAHSHAHYPDAHHEHEH